jgi:hypothetical protein
MALFDQNFYIARLHGRAEIPDSIVLDEADYRELLSYQEYLDLLMHIFTDYEVLFVGFSFADPAITHVFDIIEKRLSPNFPKMHRAFLPNNADEKFVAKLREYNIKTIFYDSAYDHFALWEGIKVASRDIPNQLKRDKPKPEFPLKPIQKFLATSYAQLKMSKVLQPLRDVVIDGMLLTLVRESDNKSITVANALGNLHDLLKLPISECELILRQRLDFLLKDESLFEDGENIRLAKDNGHDLTNDIKILVQGVENRILVRLSGKIYPELLDVAYKAIESILIARGWDLGAGYVGTTDEENSLDITSTIKAGVEKNAGNLSAIDKEKLFLACMDLFQNPNSIESEVLALLGRVSFALQIILNKPSEAIAHYSLLPEIIYLDSNVLMPAIVDGHPYHKVYSDALIRLNDACNNAGIPIYIAVADPFLDEIVYHRKLAIEEVSSMSLEEVDNLHEHIQLHGGAANVFVFAYSSMLKKLEGQNEKLSFQDFLQKYAPYNNLSDLKKYISNWGVKPTSLNFNEEDLLVFHKYYNELRQKYDLEPPYQRKKSILIEHEARQLLRVKLDLDKRYRVLFVTMDNKLRRFSTGPVLGYAGSALITNSAFVQLIDLLIGLNSQSDSMARLLWGSFLSDDTLVIINYFTNLALNKYDEAMAMTISEVLDTFVPYVAGKAKQEGLNISPGGDIEHKIRLSEFMDRFEDEFYEEMAKIIRKRQKEGFS